MVSESAERTHWQCRTHVKSPVASACLVCSSLRCLVRVIMSVLIFSSPTAPPCPLEDMFVDIWSR